MRIVFDVSPLSHPLTGVGNYIQGSLGGLSSGASAPTERTTWAASEESVIGAR